MFKDFASPSINFCAGLITGNGCSTTTTDTGKNTFLGECMLDWLASNVKGVSLCHKKITPPPGYVIPV